MSTIKELRQTVQKRGIKYAAKMNSTTLCKLLGLRLVKNQVFEKYCRNKIIIPVGILFVKKDMENKKFSSITKAVDSINKNPSCILYYIKRNKEIKIGGETLLIKRAV